MSESQNTQVVEEVAGPTFKDLNLSKDDIISIFIGEGILPKNFLSLKDQPISLPSLKNESKA